MTPKLTTKKNWNEMPKIQIVTTIITLFVIFAFIAKTSSSVTLSVTRICSTVVPISSGAASGITFSNNLLCEKLMQNIFNIKNFMREQSKLQILLIGCIGNVYKIK